MRIQGNDLESKNTKDWKIRSQAPKFDISKNMEKVQRLNGSGPERFSKSHRRHKI